MARDAFKLLGLRPGASAQEIKQAYKELSMTYHPDRVQPAQRLAAEAHFKDLSRAYRTALSCAGAHVASGGATAENVICIREAGAAGARGRFVWMSPAAIPLIAGFALLGGITYQHVCAAIERNRQSHRPHGLLGPTVNEFLHEHDDPVYYGDGKAERIRSLYRARLHRPYGRFLQVSRTESKEAHPDKE